MSYEQPTIAEAIRDCWSMQDAANLSGVTGSVHRWINVARQDAWDAGVEDHLAYYHPVIIAGIDKMMGLAGMPHFGDRIGEGATLAMGWLCYWKGKPTGGVEYKGSLKAVIHDIHLAYHPKREDPTDGEA